MLTYVLGELWLYVLFRLEADHRPLHEGFVWLSAFVIEREAWLVVSPFTF